MAQDRAEADEPLAGHGVVCMEGGGAEAEEEEGGVWASADALAAAEGGQILCFFVQIFI